MQDTAWQGTDPPRHPCPEAVTGAVLLWAHAVHHGAPAGEELGRLDLVEHQGDRFEWAMQHAGKMLLHPFP